MYYISPLRVTEEQISGLVKKKSSGSLSRFLDKKEANILQSDLIFYPYWISLIEASFKRPFLKDRIIKQCYAVDGCEGKINMVEGKIDTVTTDENSKKFLKPKIGIKKAEDIITSAGKNKLMYKYKQVPVISISEIELIYKPKWVVKYQVEREIKHLIIDGDTAQISYNENILRTLNSMQSPLKED
jgi:hypothetical protein